MLDHCLQYEWRSQPVISIQLGHCFLVIQSQSGQFGLIFKKGYLYCTLSKPRTLKKVKKQNKMQLTEPEKQEPRVVAVQKLHRYGSTPIQHFLSLSRSNSKNSFVCVWIQKCCKFWPWGVYPVLLVLKLCWLFFNVAALSIQLPLTLCWPPLVYPEFAETLLRRQKSTGI